MIPRARTPSFRLALIKPSHYDEDGYVIRWFRNIVPSNSLATVYGIALDAAQRKILGPDVDIEVTAIDETCRRVRIDRLIADFRSRGGFGLVGLVGVQTNEYPRALDLARRLRVAGIPVAIGGFHVSGTLAMFGRPTPELQQALDLGVTLFSGELEGRLDEIVRSAASGGMKPIYDFAGDLPDLKNAPRPWLPRKLLRRTVGEVGSFDAGRGCPFKCSFCTIINVQGRKSRSRAGDDIESIVRENWLQGIRSFLVTDDNFARNRDWETIFDRLAKLRADEGIRPRLMIQVDTMCHLLPGFVEKARRAGVTRVFIGLENINPANLVAVKKRQNKIGEYRRTLLAWKAAGILTMAGYIIGFPNDTYASVLRDIEIIKKELPVDFLEFTVLTPLPGSEDHKILKDAGAFLDPDLNKYDIEHVCMQHPRMTTKEWQEIYIAAWRSYYSRDHMKTIMRRAKAVGAIDFGLLLIMLWFVKTAIFVEGMHPIQSGLLRLKHPSERRPGLPVEPALRFYPRFLLETTAKQLRHAAELSRVASIGLRVAVDQSRRAYSDRAMVAVGNDERERLSVFAEGSGNA